MSKQCKECGHQMDDNVQVCPNCGCPVEGASASTFMDEDVLNYGKSTEAESEATRYTKTIRVKFTTLGGVLIIISAGHFIASLIAGGENSVLGIPASMASFTCGFLLIVVGKLIANFAMLFVSTSTTLKRIEIILEKLENGSH